MNFFNGLFPAEPNLGKPKDKKSAIKSMPPQKEVLKEPAQPKKSPQEIMRSLQRAVSELTGDSRKQCKLAAAIQASEPNDRTRTALAKLTAREQEIMAYVILGQPGDSRQILRMGKGGIENNLAIIRQKIGSWGIVANTRQELANKFGCYFRTDKPETALPVRPHATPINSTSSQGL